MRLILAGKIAMKAGLARIKSAYVKNAAAVIVSLFGLIMVFFHNSGGYMPNIKPVSDLRNSELHIN